MKKVLSVLLSAVMVFALIPLSVFADPEPVTNYDLWVGGIQVTSDNADNIEGYGITVGDGGYVKYVDTDKKLILANAAVSGSYVYDTENALSAGIYSKDINLTVELEGSNIITGGNKNCIYVENGSIDITGSGSLKLLNPGEAYGIRAANSVKISGVEEVLTNTGKNGILSASTSIENSTVNITTTKEEYFTTGSDGIIGTNSISISGSVVNVTSAGTRGLYSYYSISISNSTVNASSLEVAVDCDNGSVNISKSDLNCTGDVRGRNSLTLTDAAITNPVGGTVAKNDVDFFAVCYDDNGTITTAKEVEIKKTCTVSVTASPASAGTATQSGTGKYVSGEDVTITATATAEGYQFVNWTENGTSVSEDAEYTFKVDGDRNLIANFTNKEYTITAEPSSAEAGTITGGGNYLEGRSVTLKAAANEGYRFVNWKEGDTIVSTEEEYTFTAYSDRTLTANFEVITCTITVSSYSSEHGSVSGGGTYDYGQEVTLTATIDEEGYRFVNWTEDEEVVSTDAVYTFTAKADRTLVANFSNVYKIVFKNGETELESNDWTYGETPVYGGETPVKEGDAQFSYAFEGWSPEIGPVTGDQVYSATFKTQTNLYTISAVSSGNGITSGSGNIPYGSTATVVAYPAEGYHFVNWTENGTEVSNSVSYSFTVTGSRSLVANFEINTYTITFTDEFGNTLQVFENVKYGETPLYNNGAKLTKLPTAQYTYEFIGWKNEATDEWLGPAKADATYKAIFEGTLNQYLIKFVNEGGEVLQRSMVNYGEMPVYTGEKPTKASTAQFSYTFAGWDKTIVAVTEDAVYTATYDSKKFEQKANVVYYTVTFESNGGDAIEAQKIEEGGTASKPKDPVRDRFYFGGWYKDADLTQPYSFATKITSDITVYAKWVTGDDEIVITYAVIGDSEVRWSRDSDEDIVIGIERSQDDDTSLQHFQGVQIDGEDFYYFDIDGIADDKISVTIKASHIEKLTNGMHTITILFDDGQADLSIRVDAKQTTPEVTNSEETTTETETAEIEKARGRGTEPNLTGLWIALGILGGAAVIAVPIIIIRRRRIG